MRCKGNESMCDLVLASEAYRAVESRDDVMCVCLN